jgi:hypothetical protein
MIDPVVQLQWPKKPTGAVADRFGGDSFIVLTPLTSFRDMLGKDI